MASNVEAVTPKAASVATRVEEPLGGGRIPFRVRIGVTGHKLKPTEQLVATLQEQILWIHDDLVPSLHEDFAERGATPVGLAVVSELAEGADQLVVEEVFALAQVRKEIARLEVILPMAKKNYVEEQRFSPESEHDFDALLKQASWIDEPSECEFTAEDDHTLSDSERKRRKQNAYQAAGRKVIARCDVLIALWDGEESRGKGGTADTLVEAAWRGRPCIWIPTVDGLKVKDNLGIRTREGSQSGKDFYFDVERRAAVPPPEDELPWPRALLEDEHGHAVDLLQPLRDAFDGLDDFNSEELEPGFERRARDELGDGVLEALWLAGPFARGAEIADRHQRRFNHLAWTIFGLVTLAAFMLALSISVDDHFAWAEVTCLAAAAFAFRLIRKRDLHGRWLSARVVAERLRSAFCVAPTRRDFRRVTGLEAVYIERHSPDWVQRASEEVWDRRPQASRLDETLPAGEFKEVKKQVAAWIDHQIRYHKKAAGRHERRDRRYRIGVLGLLALAVVFAALDALGIVREVSIVLAITLPAAGASLGGLLTVAQHRALKQRFTKMQSDLAIALRAVDQADEDQLGTASLDAARIINQESGDWFGTMWFLDVEHL